MAGLTQKEYDNASCVVINSSGQFFPRGGYSTRLWVDEYPDAGQWTRREAKRIARSLSSIFDGAFSAIKDYGYESARVYRYQDGKELVGE